MYRLVASARSRGYHSGRFSVSAGPSILRGSWRPRRGAPATGAAGETRVCADGWALWVTGRCATPIKTEHLEIPSGRGRPPRRPLPAEVSSLGPEDAHAAANSPGAAARRPGPGEHRGRRRMPTAGVHNGLSAGEPADRARGEVSPPLAGDLNSSTAAAPARPAGPSQHGATIVTWLILPVVICLSQRLSHACLSISNYTAKLRMAH